MFFDKDFELTMKRSKTKWNRISKALPLTSPCRYYDFDRPSYTTFHFLSK